MSLRYNADGKSAYRSHRKYKELEEPNIRDKEKMTAQESGHSDKNTGGYFHLGDTVNCSFYRLPKVFFCDDRYAALSTDAKLLYALLLDRMELSAHNGLKDEQGRVYLYFTLKQVSDILHFSQDKVTKLFRELEKIRLIDRRRQGLGKASVIYPRKFHDVKSEVRKPQNKDSGHRKISVQESVKSLGSDTEYNHTENSYTELSIRDFDWEKTQERVKARIEYDILSQRSEYDKLDEILNIITEIMCIRSPYIQIGKNEYPTAYVQSRFLQLDSSHMEYIHDCMDSTTVKIKDMKAYLVSALFNAPATMNHYYQAAVRADFGM